jgi:hypothetical protein
VGRLEARLTPCVGCNDFTLSNVLDVTSAPIALSPADAEPQMALFCDGSVRLASGGAEEETSFTIEDVASLNLPASDGETSIKIDFVKVVDLTLAGATESAEIKGDAVVTLKTQDDGATAVASSKFIEVLSLKLDGAPAETDVILHVELEPTANHSCKGDHCVNFDEAASLTTSQDGVASGGTGGGAGKVRFDHGWSATVMGDAISINYTKRADLTVDDAPVLADMEKWDITPAAPAAGTTNPSSLMLDGMESLSLNFLTANMEYSNQWESVGDLTSLKYDHGLILLDGPTAMATQEEHARLEGESTDFTDATDITLTPNDPSDLASDTQTMACLGGRHLTLTLDDTVDLMVAGLELPSHTHQTETGDVISIEIDSLLSPPGPGPGG